MGAGGDARGPAAGCGAGRAHRRAGDPGRRGGRRWFVSERRLGGGDGAGGLSDGRGQPAATDLVRPVGHGAGHGRRPGWHISPVRACPPTAVAWPWPARCRATPTSGCWTAPARADSRSMRLSTRIPSGRPTAPGSCSARTGRVQFDLYQKLTSGAGVEERLVASDQVKVPNSWSADGRFLLYQQRRPADGTSTSGSYRWWGNARRRCS